MNKRQFRGHGDGTISLRKDGRFEVRVSDPLTGKRKSVYGKTEAEARRKLREMVLRKEKGEPVSDMRMTLTDYSTEWFRKHAMRGRAESTVREYQRRMKSYVLPRLGKRKLHAITKLDVEEMLESCADDGLARSSLKGIQNALAAMLSDAVSGHQLRANVARDIRLPQVPERQTIPHASVEEVGRLLEESQGTDLEELLTLLAYTGCRIGEALGARWSDFELEEGVWHLNRTTALNKDGQVVVGSRTKTGESRVVSLLAPVVDALRAQKSKVAKARLKAGRLWNDQGLVFPTSVGTPQDSRNLRKEFRKIAERAGFRHSFHQLRHFFATVAASEVSLASLSKVLGHKRTATTSDLYAHLYAPDAKQAASAVGRVLDQKQGA